jgi:hypothetical protein
MLRTTVERPLTRRLSMNRKITMLVTSTAHLSQFGRPSIQYNSGGKYKAVDNSENTVLPRLEMEKAFVR